MKRQNAAVLFFLQHVALVFLARINVYGWHYLLLEGVTITHINSVTNCITDSLYIEL